MTPVWQTIEEAAVTLGLSVRTVNRHITAGKLQSRLFEGRREVLIAPEDLRGYSSSHSANARASVSEPPSADVHAGGVHAGGVHAGGVHSGTADPSKAPADRAPAYDPAATTHSQNGVYAEGTNQMHAMLALADSVDDKASLAVSAYQTLARSAELQVHSLRRAAFGAWAAVGVMAVGVIFAVGWGTYRLTTAEVSAGNAQSKLAEQADAAKQLRAERDEAKQELSATQNQLANLRGQVSVLHDQNEQAKASSLMAAYVLQTSRPTERPINSPANPATQPTGSDGRAVQASGVVPGATSKPTTHPANKTSGPQNRPTYITNSAEAFDPK